MFQYLGQSSTRKVTVIRMKTSEPYVGIKHIGNGWDIRLENHELQKSAWAETGAIAFDKAQIIADYVSCKIVWKSTFDEKGNIIQLSEPV